MSRDIEAGMQAALAANALQPILMFRADFDSAPVYAWSGIGDLTYDSKTWLGTGIFLTASQIDETKEVRAAGVTFALNGVPSELLSIALTENYQGRAVYLYLGALNDSGALISDPVLLFTGRMDVMSVEDGGESAILTMSAESRLIDLQRPRARRYTHEDQQIDFPGDRGFEFVQSLQDKQITWHKDYIGD